MDPDKLFAKVGKLIEFKIEDRDKVKRIVNRSIRDLANGRRPKKLSGPVRWAVNSCDEDFGIVDDVLPKDICKLLRLKPGSSYRNLP